MTDTSKIVSYGFDPIGNGYVPIRVDTTGVTEVNIQSASAGFFLGPFQTFALGFVNSSPNDQTQRQLATSNQYQGNVLLGAGATVGGTGNATYLSDLITPVNTRNAVFIGDITITGVMSVVMHVQAWFQNAPFSGTQIWRDILLSAAITATGQSYLSVGSTLTDVANQKANAVLAPYMRMQFVCTGAGTVSINPFIQFGQ